MTILGISAYYHDSAAAIIIDGVIIAAAQEERFTRIKNDNDFPKEAIKYCLSEAGKSIDELDAVVFYDKSFLKFERLLETYYNFAPKGLFSFFKAIPVWVNEKIFIKKNIRKELSSIQTFNRKNLKLLFSEHHLSHAASAFFASGYQEAAILTIDGVGEWATTTICKGTNNKIEILKELHFPHSIGLLYSAFTYYLGFVVNSDEYKLMGLAPYGNPGSPATNRFIQLIKECLVQVSDDGSVLLNQEYFNYAVGLTMTDNKKFEKVFGFPKRNPGEEFTQEHLDLAYAIQNVTEEIVIKLARHAKLLTQSTHLCLAGGVALNCVANGKLQVENIFTDIFIQPAAGDAGGALGAALAGYHIYFDQPLTKDVKGDKMQGAYLGPRFSDNEILDTIKTEKINYRRFSGDNELCSETAKLIADGNVVGWFQGRMEFGPRALGNRSILANAAYPDMQRTLNLKIKFRESFRPFAPALPEEFADNYFSLDAISPYMLMIAPVRKTKMTNLPSNYNALSLDEKLHYPRSEELQAVTHVDGTARVQTVSADTNQLFYRLLSTYKTVTNSPVLVNTSFNVKDEPIVCTPKDAIECFLKTGMDYLIMNTFILSKKDIH